MPSVGFEPKIPAFEKAKTVHALNRAATVQFIHKISHISYPTRTQDQRGEKMASDYLRYGTAIAGYLIKHREKSN
jgi:hypothetical protein